MPISRPLTRPAITRGGLPRSAFHVFAIAIVALLAGCSTAGPGRLYLHSAAEPRTLHDIDPLALDPAVVSFPSHIHAGDTVLGLAYDPYTDHLFLRLNPGNRFRVIDRPARKIKRGFRIEGATFPSGGGDLAIRSRDRHLFLSHPTEPALIEITLYGRHIRTFPLQGLSSAPTGVAYDPERARFIIGTATSPDRLSIFDLRGDALGHIPLARPIRPDVLAYDAAAGEIFARLAEEEKIGVFNESGGLVRTLDLPAKPASTHFDVGPRSFLRLF